MYAQKTCFVFAICLAATSQGYAQGKKAEQKPEQKRDPYSLVLVQRDLLEAGNTMTICDVNEDGFIDTGEKRKLSWQADFATFDLNRDGKLTHLEVAIRLADQRAEFDITQFDINNSKAGIRKRDRNRNGQLDPSEIAAGWPKDPRKYDMNSDGIITMMEYARYLADQRIFKRELGIEAVDNMSAVAAIKRFDADRDGVLDEEEWTAANLPRKADLHDEDKDSKLSHLELAILYSKHRRATGLSKSDAVKAKRLIQMADVNGDGKLTDRELEVSFVFAGQESPTDYGRYDADKDGTVTLAEIQSSFAAERKRLGYDDSHLADAKRLLLRYDKNKSTFIELLEFPESPLTQAMKSDRLRTADLNSDGKVSLDELAKHLAKE